MTPNELLVDRLKTVVTVTGLAVIAYFAIKEVGHQRLKAFELAVYPRYTIGEVVKKGYVYGPSPHSTTTFVFTVGDSTYTKQGPDGVPKGLTRFLIKFSTKHPEYYKFYEHEPIPYDIRTAPPEGWTEPPFPVSVEVEKQ